MTKQSTTPDHHMRPERTCGHHASLSVAALPDHLPADAVQQIQTAALCSKCGLQAGEGLRIVSKQ